MAKAEWGTKRTCTGCGARFYDMLRTPVTCPKCDATVEVDLPFKPRRSSAQVEKAAAAPVREVAKPRPDPALEVDDEAESEELESDDDDSGLIEDASDLGEDDEDMAEVMEHIDEPLEDEV